MKYFLLIFSVLVFIELNAQDYSQINQWTEDYCNAANSFIDDFIKLDNEQEKWELSYIFIQHYKRTINSIDKALALMDKIELPDGPSGLKGWLRSQTKTWSNYYYEVEQIRELNQITIESLNNLKNLAIKAINDIENANSQSLFLNAINNYNEKAKKESDRIEEINNRLSSSTKSKIQNCILKYLP